MADEKISALPAAGALGGSELVVVVKSGVTSQSTATAVAGLASGTNLGDTDLTSSANERTFTLNGSLSTNLLTIDNGSGAPIVKFRGDDAIEIPTGVIGIGTGAVNSSVNIKVVGNSYGFFSQNAITYGLWVSGSPANAGRFETAKVGGVGGYYSVTAATGSNTGLDCYASTTNTGTNTALRVNAANGGSNNAIYVTAGDINIGGSVGLTATYNFGGGGSGDIATMTYSKGILTGITTVP